MYLVNNVMVFIFKENTANREFQQSEVKAIGMLMNTVSVVPRCMYQMAIQLIFF